MAIHKEYSEPKTKPEPSPEDMLPEYDFSKGIRGLHYRPKLKKVAARVHKGDGSIVVHYFTEADGAVVLDPDVRKHFRTAKAVNKALRELIAKR